MEFFPAGLTGLGDPGQSNWPPGPSTCTKLEELFETYRYAPVNATTSITYKSFIKLLKETNVKVHDGPEIMSGTWRSKKFAFVKRNRM